MWSPGPFASIALAGICAAATESAPEWRVELRSSGGFTGRGTGGVAVQSDGTVSVMRPSPAPGSENWVVACTQRMPQQINALADAVRDIQPQAWHGRDGS